MKTKAIIALIVFWGCIYNTTAQEIRIYNAAGHDITGDESLPNIIQFKITNLDPPPQDPTTTKRARWGYLWDFGDCSAPSGRESPIHKYPAVVGDYVVSLTLTPIYSDDDEDDTLTVYSYPGANSSDTVLSVVSPLHIDGGNDVTINFPTGNYMVMTNDRPPKPGNLVTVLIPFKNAGTTAIENGSILFEFAKPSWVFNSQTLNGCGYDEHSELTDPVSIPDSVVFKFSDLEVDEERILSVPLLTDTDVESGDILVVKAKLYRDTNLTNLIESDSLSMVAINSYDPNEKTPLPRYTCNSDSITYKIEYENEGTDYANLVYIIDDISPHLDITSFNILEVSIGEEDLMYGVDQSVLIDETFNPHFLTWNHQDQHLKVLMDVANRKIAWVYRDIDLLGTGQDMLIFFQDTVIDETGGMVKYSMKVDQSVPLQYTDEFGGPAEIFFDDNEPIKTSAAKVTVLTCICGSSGNSTMNEWIQSVQFDTTTVSSGNNGGYADYTNMAFEATAGNSYLLSLSPGYTMQHNLHWEVYADFNRDGVMTNGEQLANVISDSFVTVSVTIPTNSLRGYIPMRVIGKDVNGTPGPCGSPLEGEVEDFLLNVTNPFLPDYSVTAVQQSVNKVLQDSAFTLTHTIKNIGDATVSEMIDVSFFLSSDVNFSMNDVSLGSTTISAPAANQEVVTTSTLSVPGNVVSGKYYILTIVDYQLSSNESDEMNNLRASLLKVDSLKSELELSDLQACANTIAGNKSIRYVVTIKNTGDVVTNGVNGSGALRFYLSNDSKLDTSDIFLDEELVDSLAANEEKEIEKVISFPVSADGSKYVIAKVDALDQIHEESELNNSKWHKVTYSSEAYAQLPYYTGFECASTDIHWSDSSSTSGQHIKVTTENEPAADNYHLQMLMDTTSNTALNSADLHVNLQGYSDVFLSFAWTDFGDVSDSLDGIYLSDDGGNNFIMVHFLDGSVVADSSTDTVLLSLNNYVVQYGIQYTDSFVIRFQQSSLDTLYGTGMAFDQVEVFGIESNSKRGSVNGESDKELEEEVNTLKVYPNPSNQVAKVQYSISEDSPVSLELYDLSGRKVRTLMSQKNHVTGSYEIEIQTGELLSGTYICLFRSSQHIQALKFMIAH